MEAARTSETSVNFYQTTRRYNPDDSHLRTHRRDNLKSYSFILFAGRVEGDCHTQLEHQMVYSACKISLSLSYVTVRGERKMERARGSKTAKSLSMYSFNENIFPPFNFDIIGGILIPCLLHYAVFCEPKEL
jgi:hypothetical protein